MKKKCLSIAVVLALMSAITIQSAFAQNTTATAALSGSVTVAGAGDWASTISATGNVSPTAASTATWTSTAGAFASDFIQFVDANAAADGAYLQIKFNTANKYTYAGQGVGNTGLVSNTFLAANYPAATPTSGTDTTKNANLITASTCSAEQLPTTNLLFHTDLRSSSKQFALAITSANKTLFRILPTSECTTVVKLGFEALTITYPALTTSGTYTNTIVLTANDGAV